MFAVVACHLTMGQKQLGGVFLQLVMTSRVDLSGRIQVVLAVDANLATADDGCCDNQCLSGCIDT